MLNNFFSVYNEVQRLESNGVICGKLYFLDGSDVPFGHALDFRPRFFKNVDVYGIWPNWNIGFVQISRLLVQKSRCETKFHYDNDPNGNLESPW